MKALASQLATPSLSQANAVGQGFDIFGEYDIGKGSIQALVDSTLAPTQTFTFQGKDYLIPVYINPISDPKGYLFQDVADTREEFQSNMSASVGIKGSYGGFSGEMKASYANEFQSNARYSFAYIKQYIPLAYLELKDSAKNYLTAGFKQRVAQLPASLGSDLSPFEQFFQDFGIYYTSFIVIGGSVRFTSAVSKSSQLSVDDLSFSASAQYKAVTEVGSFGADVTGKAYWKNYLQSSQGHTYVEVSGGLDDKISALQQAFDPDNPSSVSVNRFSDWAKSIAEDPGVVDFKLSPIWGLCGDKRDVVQQAWELYAAKMRPRLMMEVSSSKTDDITVRTTEPPVIVLNGRQIKPAVKPDSSWGYQVLILDGSHLADQSGILFNQYFSAGSFEDAYRNLYPKIYDAINNSGHIDDGNVLILASYGLDQNLPPSGDIYGLLQSAGAGKVIKQWTQASDPGSEDDGDWGVADPATYLFVGAFGGGVDSGVEQHQGSRDNSPPSVSDRVTAYFYREIFSGSYTIGT